MIDGAFSPSVNAAIRRAHLDLCVGCARPVEEVHHRCPRRAGGTSNPAIAEPWNGLGLCCWDHAWSEAHRDHARLLGWLTHTPDPDAPFWTVRLGWCTWWLTDDTGPPTWLIRPFQDPPSPHAEQAAGAYLRHREGHDRTTNRVRPTRPRIPGR